MFEKNINKIGDVNGNHNQVIQIILSDGHKVEDTLSALIEPLVKKEREDIDHLKKQIAEKDSTIKDKSKIIELLDSDNSRLKTKLLEKKVELKRSEKRFAEIFITNNGKDFTGSRDLYGKALKLLTEGKKDAALQILNRQKLIEEREEFKKDREQKANGWLLRADLLKDRGIWGEKLDECYESVIEIKPNLNNYFKAANHFKFVNQFEKAEGYYKICLLKTSSDKEKAVILNNLAILQTDKNQIEIAEKNFHKALKIRKGLARVNPQTFLTDVADTLNNLANLQSDKKQIELAEENYYEAIGIYKELAKDNQQRYLPEIGRTLNNMALLQDDNNQKDLAEKNYNEAIKIYRELAAANPETYLALVALTLNNIANLQINKNQIKLAEANYNEALKIRRELSIVNPQTYLPNVANSLNNLAVLQSKNNHIRLAEKNYKEALKIRRELAKANPQTFLPDVATTLNNIAALQVHNNQKELAERNFNEALKIRREFEKVNSQIYSPKVAETLINLSIFYKDSIKNKGQSLAFLDEAITILFPFSNLPYIQKYFLGIENILLQWQIKPDEYIENIRNKTKK